MIFGIDFRKFLRVAWVETLLVVPLDCSKGVWSRSGFWRAHGGGGLLGLFGAIWSSPELHRAKGRGGGGGSDEEIGPLMAWSSCTEELIGALETVSSCIDRRWFQSDNTPRGQGGPEDAFGVANRLWATCGVARFARHIWSFYTIFVRFQAGASTMRARARSGMVGQIWSGFVENRGEWVPIGREGVERREKFWKKMIFGPILYLSWIF